jgi:hypothetical protein
MSYASKHPIVQHLWQLLVLTAVGIFILASPRAAFALREALTV